MNIPTIDPDVYDAATVPEMHIIHDFAHGHSTDIHMEERILSPWIDADARLIRRKHREEAPAA